MSTLDQIKQHISADLKHFDTYFSSEIKTNVPLLNLVLRYLLRKKGKQMRPLLVFLIAKLFGNPGESTNTAAALIEILHTATRIHDDVVDEYNEHKSFFSINAIWKSKVAVLIGDYLLAKGLLLAVNKKEYEILNLVADAVKEMSEGELLQIRYSRKLNITEADYFEIIRKKTATLISCCCSCGAKSVDMPNDIVKKIQFFGELLGIAFQIKDDILDYQLYNIFGKPASNAIQDKKFTLPLIHALEMSDSAEKKKILRLMSNSAKSTRTFNEIRDFINKNNGIKYAEEKMNAYAFSALNKLSQFPNVAVRESLQDFIFFALHRSK
jgi:octaprenyl-diphosphate synthase